MILITMQTMLMSGKEIPTINPAFEVEKFENEILLYDPVTNKAVYLNHTAYAVWLLCKERLPVDQIIILLEDQYPEEKGSIRSEVLSALRDFETNEVITLEGV